MRGKIYSANDYHNGIKELAHNVKDGDPKAIQHASSIMANMVGRSGCVFIPIPSHNGNATYTKELSELIAQKTNGISLDILSGKSRKSLYDLKKMGKDVSNIDLGITLNDDFDPSILNGKIVFLVDNVIGTGETYKQASKVLKNILGHQPKLLTIGNDTSIKDRKLTGKQKIGNFLEENIDNIIYSVINEVINKKWG